MRISFQIECIPSRLYTHTCVMLLPQLNDGGGFQDEHLNLLLHKGRELGLALHMLHKLLEPHELELAGHNSLVIELTQRLLFQL